VSRVERAASPPEISSRARHTVCGNYPPTAAAILAISERRHSMGVRTLLASCGALLALITGVHAASPDDPGAPAPSARYSPVTSGTKSYRPVEPLPWGDVNRRVTPQAKQPPAGKDKGAMPEPSSSQHKH